MRNDDIEPAAGGCTPAPRPHQSDAVDAAADTLADSGSALVVMATGTGKTLVGAWVAARVESRRTLVLVPTLELVAQTLREYSRLPWFKSSRLVAVCSDRQLGRSGHLDVDVTGDPDRIAAAIDGDDVLVVATYHSSDKLTDATARAGGFDLAVCDEAHHLAGDPGKGFAAILRRQVQAERRLFLTATPRTFRRAGTAVSMDDGSFGTRVFDLRLGAAVEAGLAADYRLSVAAADPDVVAEVTSHLAGTVDGTVDADTVGRAAATLQAMRTYGIRRLVTFHSRIGRAHEFASALLAAAEHIGPDGPGTVAWVSSGSRQADRRDALDALADPDRSRWVIVCNARLLTEGVDVPDLDAVAIVDPKSSNVDVAQAVGRALRVRPGKTARVIVPAVVGPEQDPLDERALDTASSVIRSLRSHDPRLGDRLDDLRRRRGTLPRGEYFRLLRARLATQIEFDLPEQAARRLADAVAVAVVLDATADWEQTYGLLETYAGTYGHADVPQQHTCEGPEGTVHLGRWVSSQRRSHSRGHLDEGRVAALECLPGWRWNARRARVDSRIGALTAWLSDHPGVRTPPRDTLHAGHNVNQVCNYVRQAFASGKLDPNYARELEQVDGWVWNQREADWWDHAGELAQFAATHGHAAPSSSDLTPDGFKLGKWVAKQRSKLRDGTLDDEQADALRTLPGWVDDVREAAWQDNLVALRRWVELHGHASPGQADEVDSTPVGRWVAKQRSAWRRGSMTVERARQLEALPGWDWSPGGDRGTWEQAADRVAAYAAEHGSARVLYSHTCDDGFNLGHWVAEQRQRHRSGTLDQGRASRLERMDGWTWDPTGDDWWERYGQVRDYLSGTADAAPYGWLEQQLDRDGRGRLDGDQSQALRALLELADDTDEGRAA